MVISHARQGRLIVACDDGTLWTLAPELVDVEKGGVKKGGKPTWYPLPPIPQDAP